MYDTSLTRMSLPSEHYRLLLGTALSVFSSNNSFIIENILRTNDSHSWYDLMDKESGRLRDIINKNITSNSDNKIEEKFMKIVQMRNRIIHGFRITSQNNEQIIATKVKGTGEQFDITEDYLKKFIKLNEELSQMLHVYRGY